MIRKNMKRCVVYCKWILIAIALVGADNPSVRIGALEWEKTKAEARLRPGDLGADASFTFKNVSDKPLVILEATANCSCTVGKLEKRRFDPGETGELKVHFTAGGKRGKYLNWLTVNADSGDSIHLQFGVEIPEIMTVNPRFLLWKDGERAAKSIDVKFEGAGRIEKAEAVSELKGIVAIIEPTSDVSLWKLTVTPPASISSPKEIVRTQIALKAKTELAGVVESRVFVQLR